METLQQLAERISGYHSGGAPVAVKPNSTTIGPVQAQALEMAAAMKTANAKQKAVMAAISSGAPVASQKAAAEEMAATMRRFRLDQQAESDADTVASIVEENLGVPAP